jgi:hypothetical protein
VAVEAPVVTTVAVSAPVVTTVAVSAPVSPVAVSAPVTPVVVSSNNRKRKRDDEALGTPNRVSVWRVSPWKLVCPCGFTYVMGRCMDTKTLRTHRSTVGKCTQVYQHEGRDDDYVLMKLEKEGNKDIIKTYKVIQMTDEERDTIVSTGKQ